MKSPWIMSLLLGLVAFAPARGEDRTAAEQNLLQGTWVVVSCEMFGKPDDSAKGVRFTFSHKELTIERDGRKCNPIVYQINPTKTPKEIDFEEKVPPTAGFYKLEGDRLRLCYGAERPEEFKAGAGVVFAVLKRERSHK